MKPLYETKLTQMKRITANAPCRVSFGISFGQSGFVRALRLHHEIIAMVANRTK
jgi:hypothetical protein